MSRVRPDRFRCSDAARTRSDPLAGTAAPAKRWLLVEHPGPWGINAWASSGIEEDVRRQLSQAVLTVGARILLVRRPGRRQERRGGAWAVVRGEPGGGVTWGGWERDHDLLEALPVLLDEADDDPGGDASHDEPVLLVCTHGRHDVCCAVRGRPVGLALQERWPRQTWECSHVGGDRFAGNVVVLPDGAYYGNLDARSAVHVVEEHLSGRVVAEHLRGVSGQPPPVQVAVAEAHRRYGPAPLDAFNTRSFQQVDHDRWEVELQVRPAKTEKRNPTARPPSLLVTVDSGTEEPTRLTCRARHDAMATVYRVVDVSETG